MSGVALVLGEPEGAGCTAEGEGIAGVVHIQTVAQGEVVGVALDVFGEGDEGHEKGWTPARARGKRVCFTHDQRTVNQILMTPQREFTHTRFPLTHTLRREHD